MRPSPARTGRVSPALDAVCGVVALLVPLAVTVLRTAATAEWRDDVAIVTGLGFVPFGAEGGPSALLAELLALLPVGGRVLREGLVGALGCGLAGAALYRVARAALTTAAATPRLSPLLALTAALTAALSPVFQREGTTSGGAVLAVAVVLLDVARRGDAREESATLRAAVASGAVFGLLLAERRLAAGLLAGYLGVSALLVGAVPRRRVAAGWALGALSVYGFWLVPLLVRPMAAHAWLDLGPGLSSHSSLLLARLPEAPNAVLAWARDMGPLALALGAFGILWSLLSGSARGTVLPLTLWIAAAAIWPHERAGALAADPLAPLELLATAALALAAVLGVQTAVVLLARFRVPFAEPAGVLLVVFHLALVFVAAEQTSDVVTETTGLAADVWTDEALSELPPNALVLVRSRALAFRIWAARVTRGERPDLVMVPLGLLDRGSVSRRLLEQEPALGPLIRDVAMTGKTSEFAMSLLSDARPLYVELDPSWDRPLLSHLLPTPLWLRFVPHTLGRSDRTSALADAEGRRAFSHILAVARQSPGSDPATLAILGEREREKAVLLAAIGDRDSALSVLSNLSRIAPEDTLSVALGERLKRRAGPNATELRELVE